MKARVVAKKKCCRAGRQTIPVKLTLHFLVLESFLREEKL